MPVQYVLPMSRARTVLISQHCTVACLSVEQNAAIQMAVDVVRGALPGVGSVDPERTLFLVGAYNIGKERLLLAVSDALKKKVVV